MASERRTEREHVREIARLGVELPMRVATPRATWPALVEELLRGRWQGAGEILRAVHSVDRVQPFNEVIECWREVDLILNNDPEALAQDHVKTVADMLAGQIEADYIGHTPLLEYDEEEPCHVQLVRPVGRGPLCKETPRSYIGWNLRDLKSGMANERVSFWGSWLPLPTKSAGAERDGDSREAIAERYPLRGEYLRRFSAAAEKLARERFLLKEDVEALVRRGDEEWDYVTKE